MFYLQNGTVKTPSIVLSALELDLILTRTSSEVRLSTVTVLFNTFKGVSPFLPNTTFAWFVDPTLFSAYVEIYN